MGTSSESVHKLLKDLTNAHFHPNNKKTAGNGRFSTNVKKLCFEVLLSHRDESSELEFSIFDRILVKSYEMRVRNDSESADRMDSLVTLLRTTSSEDYAGVLRLLHELADTQDEGLQNDCLHLAPLTNNRTERKMDTRCLNVTKFHSYDHFSRFLFEATNNLMHHKSSFENFNSKLFETYPGFEHTTKRLSCNMYRSPLLDTVASSLYGALSHPLKDPWRLDTRLEFLELSDEAPALRLADLRTFVVDAPSKAESKSQTPLDEDEGFVETTDTPSSVGSFSCVAATAAAAAAVEEVDVCSDVFDAALKCGPAKDRYATWETLGCYCPPLEKPLLSEAGSKAFDQVLSCYQHELSIFYPDLILSMPKSALVDAADLFRDAINVLIGISSKTFVYDQTKELFRLANVTISGLSCEAISKLLSDFANCGTAYRRLDLKLKLSVKANGVVRRAFFNAVDCYVRYFQESVLAVKDRSRAAESQSQLLHLDEATARLRRQICLIARLCFLNEGEERELPVGLGLIRHLYDAVQTSGVAVEDRSVFLSFLIAASDPYIRYLCFWAFEGQRFDPYDEFPIIENSNSLQAHDERFWKELFRLSDASDPLIGQALNAVFICGKSLHLLRVCCPKHILLSPSELSPNIAIVFSDEKQKKQRDHNIRYYSAMKSKAESLVLNRELRQLLLERDKEELLRRAQETARNTLIKIEMKYRARLMAERAKKAVVLADLKAQMETHLKKKVSNRQKIQSECLLVEEDRGLAVDCDIVANAEIVSSDSTETLESLENSKHVGSATSESTLSETSELPDVSPKSSRDSNMNLLQVRTVDELTTDGLDSNANEEHNDAVERSEVALRAKADLSIHSKGIKRKHDRDSIDFETGGVPRRPPKTDQGVLVEGRTFAVLRTRGRGAHGHVSDSTIQRLIYGGETTRSETSKPLNDPPVPVDVIKVNEQSGTELIESTGDFTNLKAQPYSVDFKELDEPPMADVFTRVNVDGVSDDDVAPATLFRLPLSVTFNRCLVDPLRDQIRYVDSCLLDFFLNDLKAEEHLSALRDYFFMQNGEFAQRMCDLLFERLSACSSPTELLNPVVLNSILSRAITLLPLTNHYSENLGFVVKYVPKTLQPNSPSSLNCLCLSYRVDWPLNILFSSEHLGSYERIFSFVLQIRRCSWALTHIYSVLKDSDKKNGLTSSPQFRLLQFFRHEMNHFIRSLYEYVVVQAFQVSWFRLQDTLHRIKNLEELLEFHSKYLRQIMFRCLLHNKAAPVMKIVQDIFSIILKFCDQLSSHPWKRNSSNGLMEFECFPQLQSLFKIFQEYSTFLYKVISKLVERGYQTHLQELLLRLDFSNYYASLSSRGPDVSCPSLLSCSEHSLQL